MDNEQFKQLELSKINEFTPQKGEFFNVPEHSRPKMEDYKVPETSANSNNNDKKQNSTDESYRKKMMENANGSHSAPSPAPGNSGLGTSGVGGTSAASSAATSGGATALTTTAAAAGGVGTVLLTAVVGGAALGVVPIVDKNYGTLNSTNYISEIIEEDGQQYQLLTFNFEGEIKDGYLGEIRNNKTNEVYKVDIANPKVKIKSLKNDKSLDFTFLVTHQKSKEVVYEKSILIEEPLIDYETLEFLPVYKTTYIEDTNSLNLYFYLNTNYFDLYDYPITNIIMKSKNESFSDVKYEPKVVKEFDNKSLFVIENIPLNNDTFAFNFMINKDNNLFTLDCETALSYDNKPKVDIDFEGQMIELDFVNEKPIGDFVIEIIDDDNNTQSLTIEKGEIEEKIQVKKLLNKEILKPKFKATYKTTTPGTDDPIFDDESVIGLKEMPKIIENSYDNNPLNTYGDFEYVDYQITHIKDETNPRIWYKDIAFNFKNTLNTGYYLKFENPLTHIWERIENPNIIKFDRLSLEIKEFNYQICSTNSSIDEDDDYPVKMETIIVEDDFVPPPMSKDFGSFKLKNYDVTYYEEDYKIYEKLLINFEGELKEGFEATLINNSDQQKSILTTVNNKFENNFIYKEIESSYTLSIKNIEFNEEVYKEDINIEHIFDTSTGDAPPFNPMFKTTYIESNNTCNTYFVLDSPYFEQPNPAPLANIDVQKLDDTTGEYVPVTYRKLEDNNNGGLYVIENCNPNGEEIIVKPTFTLNGNTYGVINVPSISYTHEANVNDYLDAMNYKISLQYDEALSNVDVEVTHEDGEVENFSFLKDEVSNGYEKRVLLKKFSNTTKFKVSYLKATENFDYVNLINPTYLVGAEQLRVTSEKVVVYDPTLSYGTFKFDNHLDSAIDDVNQTRTITFNFINTLNEHYYFKIINPKTNEEVTTSTVNQLIMTNAPLDVAEFTLLIYHNKFNSDPIDDYVVYKDIISAPNQGPIVM